MIDDGGDSPIYKVYRENKDVLDFIIEVSSAHAAMKMGPEFLKVFSIRERFSKNSLG